MVSEDTTFEDLHDIIQLVMGWENCHLYEFKVKGVKIYDFQEVIDDQSNPAERDSMDTFLSDLVNQPKSTFTYLYDFGDSWEHLITVEKIVTVKEFSQPQCMDGHGACPPEDIGGIWHYQEMLGYLTDKDHPEHEEAANILGEDWDPSYFNLVETNELLQEYCDEWEEIYEDAERTLQEMDDHEDDWMIGRGNENRFNRLKKITGPEDILKDPEELAQMNKWMEAELREPISEEYQAFERLRNLGFDQQQSESFILQALAIEWFSDLKYGSDHLEERYTYNLRNLPESPQEFPRLEDAFTLLDSCHMGVPFAAIEHIQNDASDVATEKILEALRNHSDHQYCWADCSMAPFWYALAAEGHLCKEMIDPVIELYNENENNSDWLFEQGQVLIGKLAKKYPELTPYKVLDAMELDLEKSDKPSIYYLFDAFYFGDVESYKPRLLALLSQEQLYWYEMLASAVAYLGIKEALPILRARLEKLEQTELTTATHDWNSQLMIEMEEAILILEGKIILDEEAATPLCEQRYSWKEELEKQEFSFYEETFDQPNFDESLIGKLFQESFFPPAQQPVMKEKTPSRNDPCPCGSGKKYKKCCMH